MNDYYINNFQWKMTSLIRYIILHVFIYSFTYSTYNFGKSSHFTDLGR